MYIQQPQQQPGSIVHQQQADPRLLLGLPAPALRRVLQLASTPASPALCRLCCVSKGLRAAAEAAAPPVDITVSRPPRPLLTTGNPAAQPSSSLFDSPTEGAPAPSGWTWTTQSSSTAHPAAPAPLAAPLAPQSSSTAHPAPPAAAVATPAAGQHISLRQWLGRHGHRVRGLSVGHHGGPAASGHDLLLAIANSAAAAVAGGGSAQSMAAAATAEAGAAEAGAAEAGAAAAAGGGGGGAAAAQAGGAEGATPPPPPASAASGAAPTAGTATGDGRGQGRRGQAHAATSQQQMLLPLERLHLRHVTLSPPLVNTLVRFDQLQVLVLTGSMHTMASAATQQLLLQALPKFQQLQKLSLQLSQGMHQLPGNVLLHSLPRNLIALDLNMHGGPCSSSSLAHLVHLTSLRLQGVDLVADPDSYGQQQEVAAAATAGEEQVQRQLGDLQLSQQQPHTHHPYQQQQQEQGQQQQEQEEGRLAALSMRPTVANSWFAVPSIKALELVYDSWCDEAHLTQLAACPHLRQLRVQYCGHFPDPVGVSALTQLSRLRLETWALPEETDVGGAGAELAKLGQLQVLEVCFASLEPLQPKVWLPQLHELGKLVVLVSPGECHSMTSLNHLVDVLTWWHSSSSSSSGSSSSSSGSSSGSGGGGGGGNTGGGDTGGIDTGGSGSSGGSRDGGDGGNTGSGSSSGDGSGSGSGGGSSGSVSGHDGGNSHVDGGGGHNSSSDSGSNSRLPPAHSGHASGASPADSALQCVELLLWSASGSDWEGSPPAAEHQQLQQAAAGMAARLPWLKLSCGLDNYTCPCWTGEEEEEQLEA